MRLRTILVMLAAIFVASFIISCSSNETEKLRDFAAAEAAKQYYDSLNNGGYDYFVRNTNTPDTIPDSYRQQLVDNMKMYIANLRQAHSGIDSITVQNCVVDSVKATAEAFLELHFSDKTKEEIVVPMVKQGEHWLMK